jgi:hypothetical protein
MYKKPMLTRRGFLACLLAAPVAAAVALRAKPAPAPSDGTSIRFIRTFDLQTGGMPCRMDVFYGFGTVRPDFVYRGYHRLS